MRQTRFIVTRCAGFDPDVGARLPTWLIMLAVCTTGFGLGMQRPTAFAFASTWGVGPRPEHGTSATNGATCGAECLRGANHMQVEVSGTWHDVPLMPLADHLCSSGHPLLRRYCDAPPQGP